MTADQNRELLALIERALQGDEAALGQILHEHRDWLRLVAQRELHSKIGGRLDASDVVQQTFLSACRQIQNFQGKTSAEFAAWLGQIHQRNITDAIRQHVAARKRSVKNEQPLSKINPVAGEHQATSPSHHAIRNERSQRLLSHINELPADQAEAVRLRHLEGWPLVQIAEHLGRSTDAAASLLKRGVQQLRKRLSDENP